MPVQRIEGGERWYAILDYLEESGGQLERKREQLVKDLNIPQRSLSRHLERMEELEVITVVRSRGAFGEGKLPNVYRLRITSEEWRERGPQILELAKRKAQNKKRRDLARGRREGTAPPPTPRGVPHPPQELVDEVRAQVEKELEVDGDETDAWLAGEEVDA